MTTDQETSNDLRFRQNGGSQLSSEVESVAPWIKKDLLASRYSGENQVAVGVGTPVRMWAHAHALVKKQGLEGTALRAIVGGSPTDGDLDSFERQGKWEETRDGRLYAVRRPKIVLAVQKIGENGGNGADPFRALEALDVYPSVSDGIDEGVAEGLAVLRDDGNVNATLALVRGYGGCFPEQDYGAMTFTETIHTTRTDTLHLVPPRNELLHRRNARGELAVVLEAPPATGKLDIFVVQESSGAQATDASLMAGFMGFTGNGGVHCSFDAATVHSVLLAHGPYAIACPRKVQVPIKSFGKRWGFFREKHNDEYESPVPMIVSQARELVRPTRDDFHSLQIAGMFMDHEAEQVKRQCEALGNVHVRLNLMRPWLSADGRLADFLVCDFTVPRYVPWGLVELFDEGAQERYRHGVAWDQLRELVLHTPEKEMALLIQDELRRIRTARRRFAV